MNTQTTNLLSQISQSTMNRLITEVKETIDFNYARSQAKTFSAAELWNIQRQNRGTVQRRRFL